MPNINLDFTNVETRRRIPAGKGQRVVISASEIKTAGSGNTMLAVTFKNANDEVAYANFVILPQSMWKLKMFLEAVYQQSMNGNINFNPDTIKNKSLLIDVEDEEYINNSGEPAVRSLVTDYHALSVADNLGIQPTVATPPYQAQPQPTIPTQPENAPVSPAVSPAPTPVAPQPVPQAPAAPTPAPQPTGRPKLPWEK